MVQSHTAPAHYQVCCAASYETGTSRSSGSSTRWLVINDPTWLPGSTRYLETAKELFWEALFNFMQAAKQRQ